MKIQAAAAVRTGCPARSTGLQAVVVFVATALLGWAILRRGIHFTPDSWAYWQGAVNLLEGRGYRLFSGATIDDWPPFFSIYLALWQACFGVSGGTLVAATVLASAGAAMSWVLVLEVIFRPVGGRRGMCVFLVLIYAMATRHLMSESLTEMLLPWLVLAGVCGGRAATLRRFVSWGLLAGGVGGVMMATRYAAGPLVIGAAAVLLGNRQWTWGVRGLVVSAVLLVASIPLGLTEVLWPHESVHGLGLGLGKFSGLELASQLGRGCGDWFAGPPLGFVVWLALVSVAGSSAAPGYGRQQLRRLCVFVAVSAAGLWLLFSCTYVNAELRGRFTLFVPVVTGTVALLQVATREAWLRWLVFGLVCTSAGYGALKYAVRGRAPAAAKTDQAVLDAHFIRPFFTIAPDFAGGAPRRLADGRLLVTPPRLGFLDANWRRGRR